MRKLLEVGLVAAMVCVPVGAMAARVTVTDPWVRALPGNAAGYFTMKSNEPTTISLIGAKTTACGSIMLHKSNSGAGMASMVDVNTVTLAPNEIVKFEPGSYHLMCMDPKPEIMPGKRITITLQFGDGSENPIAFAVRNAAGH